MNTYEVYCEKKSFGLEYAETVRDAIRFCRMLLFAKGENVPEGNWWVKEIIR